MEKEVEELKIIGRETKVRRIKLRNLQIKEEVLSNRRKFTKERLSVEEDLTWKERRMKWKLGEIAREVKAKGRKVLMRYGRTNIEGRWWKWDESEKRVVSGEGKSWGGGG